MINFWLGWVVGLRMLGEGLRILGVGLRVELRILRVGLRILGGVVTHAVFQVAQYFFLVA